MDEAPGSVPSPSMSPRRFPRAGWVIVERPPADLVSIATVRERLTACRAARIAVHGAPGDAALDMTPGELDLVVARMTRFLRDALTEVEDVALNIRHVDLDSLPLPPGFKVTFEHATDHHVDEEAEHQPAHS